jgi:hypothetical protein
MSVLLPLTRGSRPEYRIQALRVYEAQQGASLSNREEGIGESQTGPPHRDRAESRVRGIMEEDALLSPGLVPSDELKGATGQRMEGVGDRKDLRVIQVIGYSWPPIRRGRPKGR